MEELLIEEKAKRYDKAIERAKNYYSTTDSASDIKLIGLIFPELKECEENEDERIRKELISLFQDCIDGVNHRYTGSDSKRWLAWLRKQGEHANFRNKIQIGDKVTRNKDGVLVNLSQLNRVAKKGEKQDEQKPRNSGKILMFQDKPIMDGIKVSQHVLDFLAEHEQEQKPSAWSEEDEEMLDTLIANYKFLSKEFRDKEHNFFVEMSLVKEDLDMINWLNSLKGRVQPKQEWSEEDENNINSIASRLEVDISYWENRSKTRTNEDKKLIGWLKSLRPQKQWKPSDEQMAVLNEVINYAANSELQHWNSFIYTLLKSLREQLKKLREE